MSGPLPDTADVSILVTSSLALANVSHLTVAPVWVLNWLAMSCCQAANSFGNCVFAPMYTSRVFPAPLVPPPEPPELPPPPPQAARPTVTVVAASTARAERTVVDRIVSPSDWSAVGVAHLTTADFRRWLPPPLGGGQQLQVVAIAPWQQAATPWWGPLRGSNLGPWPP